MSATDGALTGAQASGDPLRDWHAVRAAADIQFGPVAPVPPAPPPGWLTALGEFMRALFEPLGRLIGLSWPVIEKLGIALAVIAVLALVWRIAGPWVARARRGGPDKAAAWAPNAGAALALLEDADRLAADGMFDEATHLLLRRSVAEIAAARPDWLHPASTAREIAALAGLGAPARAAFALIAARVERSLFALRPLAEQDWREARAAYADFALAAPTGGA